MKQLNNKALALLTLILILVVGFFYFGYYGVTVEISNERIKNKINDSLPQRYKTASGPISVNGIKNLTIFEGGTVNAEIDLTISFFKQTNLNAQAFLEGKLIYFKDTNIIGLTEPRLIRSEINDKEMPLSPDLLKMIDYQIQNKILNISFYYRGIYDFNDSIIRKAMAPFVQEVNFKDDNIIIYLKP